MKTQRKGRLSWPRLNLLGRILLALGAVGLIPLGLLAWRLVTLNLDAMRQQVLHANVVAVGTAVQRVEDFLDLRRALAESLAASPGLAADPQSPEARALLVGLLEARGDIDVAAVMSSDGEVIRAQRGIPEGEREDLERLLIAPGGEQPLASARRGAADAPRWVRLDAPLPEGVGVVRVLFRGEALGALVDPATYDPQLYGTDSRLGQSQARVSLVDEEGWVVGGMPLSGGELPPELVELALTGLAAGAQVVTAPGGEPVVAAYDGVAGTAWSVISRQPTAEAERIAREMILDSSFAVGLTLALSGGLAALAYVSLVRPIRQLTRVQRRLAGLRETPGGGDEIEALRSSFAALERRVLQQEEVERVFLGRYLVIGVLGEGAMGMVFRGWDPRLERPVALKTIHLREGLDLDHQVEQISRLLTEAVSAAKFNHPNIVSIYDVQNAEEAAFIAMELVDGRSLEEHLDRRKVLPPGQVACLGAAVARALGVAHAQGIVHHDVKPANILLGRDGAIKVTDFGISESLSRMARETDAVFGTAGYLPPEVFQAQSYDERGDLFGLGVVLYHSLVGHRPFQGRTSREVILQTLRAEVVPPHGLDRRVPEELGRWVMELLEKDPGHRPRDALGVAERLEGLASRLGAAWTPDFEDEEAERSETQDESLHSRLLRPSGLGARLDPPAGGERA